MQLYPAYNQHPCAYPPTRNRTNKSGGQAHHSGEIPQLHLLLSVVLYAPGLLVFLYARKTHTHDNVLNRQEMVLIGMLLIASVPATWMLVG